MDYQDKAVYALRYFTDKYGCDDEPRASSNENIQNSNHIAYVLKRGGCTYIQKALNVRRAGGALVVVYHDDPTEDVENIIPIAPKNAADNVPPVVVINNADGLKLEVIVRGRDQEKVKLSVDFDVEKKTDDSKLNVVFWMSPTNKMSYEFLNNFAEYYEKIQDHVELDVLWRIRDMPLVAAAKKNPSVTKPSDWLQAGVDESEDKKVEEVLKYCYGKGAYCALTDASRLKKPIQSLDQVISQKCLFDKAKATGQLGLFFEYANAYRKTCLMGYGPETSEREAAPTDLNVCAANLRHENFYMPKAELKSCIDDKFSNGKDKFMSSSEFLGKLKDDTNLFGQNYEKIPSMFIDENLVRGKLEAHTALSAICDSFRQKPKFCTQIHKLLDKEIEENYATQLPAEYRYMWLIIFCLVIVSSLMFLFIVWIFKKNFRDQLQEQIFDTIKGSISDYQKIHDMSARNTDSNLRGETEL